MKRAFTDHCCLVLHGSYSLVISLRSLLVYHREKMVVVDCIVVFVSCESWRARLVASASWVLMFDGRLMLNAKGIISSLEKRLLFGNSVGRLESCLPCGRVPSLVRRNIHLSMLSVQPEDSRHCGC
jgi:hypothetical protein